MQLLHKLGYIENYSSGLGRIFKEYNKNKEHPIIETSLNMFKVTFPNLNLNFDEIHKDELHRNDSNSINEPQTQNGTHNVPQNIYEQTIIELIKNNPNITKKDIANVIGKITKTVQRIISSSDRIKYVGSSRTGHWEIIE